MTKARNQKRIESVSKGSKNLTIKSFEDGTTREAQQTHFGEIPVINIQMVKEKTILYNGARLTRAEEACEAFCALVGDPDREYFVCLLLDCKNRITGIHTVSQGSLNQSIVHPRETFKAAILANAAAIILAHNHPSGDLTPSSEDLEVTRRLKEAGDLLGIRVLDHIVVNTEGRSCKSFAMTGLM